MALTAPFRRKMEFKCNLRLNSMKRHLRRVVKRSNRQSQHSLNIPANMVKALELSECIVELKIKDNSIVIKKVGETLENINSVDNAKDDGYTIHY